MSKLANVVWQRIEQRPPGDGVPAGWLPEVVYHMTAKDIPYRPEKPEYVFSFRPKGRLLLRTLAVAPKDMDSWELEVMVGPAGGYNVASVVCQRSLCSQFGENPRWPPASSQIVIKPVEELFLTIWRRGLTISKRFELILRCAEDFSLPRGGEGKSILAS